MSRFVIIMFSLFALCMMLGCDGCSRPSSTLTTLPSGKQIKITSIVPMHFANGTDALVLNCETDISIDDITDLRKEVDEIWSIFKKDVEGANMTNGVIRITHPERDTVLFSRNAQTVSGIAFKMKRSR